MANIGECRSLLFRDRKVIELSSDHRVDCISEMQRISSAGGDIVEGKINGGSKFTRSFGDLLYKKNETLNFENQCVTCDPEIK